MSERFSGKTIIITGAASGIGKALTGLLLAEEAKVVATDISHEGLTKLEQEFSSSRLVTVVGDVSSPEDVKNIINSCAGPIDGLANNAGIMDGFVPLHELTDELWEKSLKINAYGVMSMARAVLQKMIAQGYGSIVNTASAAGIMGGATGAAYTAAKHAVVGLTRHAAFMYATEGIRVNAVAPGAVNTNLSRQYDSEYAEKKFKPIFERLPYPAVEPIELAQSIAWLLSDDSQNVNGVILPSDGGWSAQ